MQFLVKVIDKTNKAIEILLMIQKRIDFTEETFLYLFFFFFFFIFKGVKKSFIFNKSICIFHLICIVCEKSAKSTF